MRFTIGMLTALALVTRLDTATLAVDGAERGGVRPHRHQGDFTNGLDLLCVVPVLGHTPPDGGNHSCPRVKAATQAD